MTVIDSTHAAIIRSTGNIYGLNTSLTWYVRISTQIDGVWHSFVSPAVSIATPSITAVRALSGDSLAFISSATQVSLSINGPGLASGTTIWVSTSAPANATTYVSGIPQVFAHNASVSMFSVRSSSWAVTTLVPHPRASTYYIYIGTASTNSGVLGAPGSDVAASTVIANSPSVTITVTSAAVKSLELNGDATLTLNSPASPVIANTRSYDFKLKGWGLSDGSTVAFRAVDGSSIATGGSIAGFVDTDSRYAVVSNVSFVGVQPGKYYTIVVTSMNVGGSGINSVIQGLTDSDSNISPNAVWVASMSVSTVTTPAVTGYPNGVLFNSTGPVVLGLSGVGLVAGSSMSIGMSGTVVYTTSVVAVDAYGRNSFIVSLGTASLTNPGSSSGFFGGTAGVYDIVINTRVAASGGSYNTVSTTATLTILASTVTSNGTVSNTAVEFGSFTITGVGLMDGTTAELFLGSNGGAARIAARAPIFVYSLARTSAAVSFDLRSSTQAGTYTIVVDKVHPLYSNARVRAISNVVISSPTSVLSSFSPIRGNNSGNTTVNVYGHNLLNGSTVSARYTGSATDFSGDAAASTITFGTAILLVVDSSATTGYFIFPSAKASGDWSVTVSSTLGAGTYPGGDMAVPSTVRASTGAVTFTVVESSAPNAPTGLTVLSAGTRSVQLRWISPGDDGTTGTIKSGGGFVVYFSSAADDRNQGCPSCFPIDAIRNPTASLVASATNYNFSNTWAYFLPGSHRDSANSTTTFSAPFNFSSSTARGIVVSTKTLGITDVLVNGSANTSAIPQGSTVTATLTIDPGTSSGDFWFVVRALDEAGNLSSADIVYSTVTARITAAAAVTVTLDANADNVATDQTITNAGNIEKYDYNIPQGSIDPGETIVFTGVPTPPADTSGVENVGGAVEITLGSAKTEFKKTVTFALTVNAAALTTKLAGRSTSLVKAAFHNGSRWVVIPDSGLTGNKVTFTTTHLTKFAVIIAVPASNLSGATVYPNPFRPALAAHTGNGIRFDLLPANTDIRIYTLAGELVIQMNAGATGALQWNAKNENGSDVASGVYFALLKGGGETKTVKLAIQR
ncbi:MAG: T9SS type A sorting domain-containing protein [Elusimicrobia bacterium]|nr:T9SS type A sorting domain-containing protein [Elusimicrobiota bacterium]